jgi:hypothetical protein
MTRILIVPVALLLAFSPARADEEGEAMKLAQKLTTEGAATYDTKDAKAMAAYHTEDSTVTIYSKDKDTGQVKLDVKRGRAEIEQLYADMFKNAGTIKSKNTVELARLIEDEMLVIYGTFQPDINDQIRVQFFQVRVKQGEKWLMTNVQLFLGAVKK